MEPIHPSPEQPIASAKSSFWSRLKRHPWLIGGGTVAVLAIAAIAFGGGSSDVEYVTARVERGLLTQTVEASGDLASLTEVHLSFERTGTISAIPVAIGDQVQQGMLLAVLASADALADLSRAQATVDLAQANINQLLAGSTDEEIRSVQALYEAAQVDYNNAVAGGAISVTTASLSLEKAQNDLVRTREDNLEEFDQAYENLHRILRENLIDIRSVLTDADNILGIENEQINDEFETVLAANDKQTMNDARYTYNHAASARDEVETAVYALTTTSSTEEIDTSADDVSEALELTAQVLYHTRRVLDATFSDSVNLSADEVSTFKATIDTARVTVQAAESTLLAQRQLINTLQIATTAAEQDALNVYESALNSYTKAQVDRDASIASAAAIRSSREADLAKIVADVRGVDLAPLQAQLAQAIADMSGASARYATTELRSPIDGVVTSIALDEGELASAGTIMVTVQNTQLDAYKVTVNISESDIAKVELNQETTMTFDAFGDDVVVFGRVMSIDPAEQAIEGVVFYEVDITLDEGVAGMKPGMSVDVAIITNQVDNALYVPQRALLQRDGVPYVRVLTESGYEERTVESGLRADGGRIEIISGLAEGEEIVLSIRE